MKRSVCIALVSAALAAPAAAAPWDTDYQMGTFVAFGGTAEAGRLSLECGDPQAGGSTAGKLFFSLAPRNGVKPGKLTDVDLIALRVDESGWFPLAVAFDGERFTSRGDMDDATRRSLLRMIETGDVVTIRTADRQSLTIGEIPLDGSAAAIADHWSCTEAGR